MQKLFLHLLLSLNLCASGSAYLLDAIDKIPDEFKDIVPNELLLFHKGLSEDDREVVRTFWSDMGDEYLNGSFEEVDKAMEELEESNPHLYEKAKILHKFMRTKIESLTSEARDFVANVIKNIDSLMSENDDMHFANKFQKQLVGIIKNFMNLKRKTQKNLETAFPGVIRNKKVQKFVTQLLSKDEL